MGTFRHLVAVGTIAGITFGNMGLSKAVELPSSTQSQSGLASSDPSQTSTPQTPPVLTDAARQGMENPASAKDGAGVAPTAPTSSENPVSAKDGTGVAQTTPTSTQNSPTSTKDSAGVAPTAPRPSENPASAKDGAGVAQTTPIPSVSPQQPVTTRRTPVPDNLLTHPNPLLFPTKPQEVQLQRQERITLQQALELARRNNPSLQVATLTVDRSRAALREALAAQYPTLNFNTDFSTSDSAGGEISNAIIRRNNPTQSTQSTITTSVTSELEFSYDVYTSGLRSANIRAAEEQVRFDELDLEQRIEQLRLDVTNAYYDLQQADEQVLISEAAVRNATRSLSDAEALERAGLGTRFDVLRSRVQLANANQELVQNRSQQRIARRQIVQLLNLPQTVDVAAADPIVEAGTWTLSLEDSIVLAYKNRAELEQQLASRNQSEQQRRAALAAIRPRISLFANYNVTDVFDDQVGLGDGYNLGARLQWNFFDGGAARARARQQEANRAIAETQFSDTRNQIRFQIEQAYSNLQANADNIQTTSIAVEQAEESLRLANLRFRAGVGTQTDVINAETELTRARVNRLSAIIGYNRALAQLQRGVSNFPNGNLSDTP